MPSYVCIISIKFTYRWVGIGLRESWNVLDENRLKKHDEFISEISHATRKILTTVLGRLRKPRMKNVKNDFLGPTGNQRTNSERIAGINYRLEGWCSSCSVPTKAHCVGIFQRKFLLSTKSSRTYLPSNLIGILI